MNRSTRHSAPPVEAGIEAIREWIADQDASMAERFWQGGEDIQALVRERAGNIDRAMVGLWRQSSDRPQKACLVAVGGYGRGELHPYSDVDLMVLLDDDAQSDADEAVGAFITNLWDLRLDVGHSVRTLTECQQQAEGDVTVMTNLMEARLLDGPEELFNAMADRLSPERVWPGPAYFRAKLAEQIQRHARFGDTAYNLEPNLKDGPGGLRDIQMIAWVAMRCYGMPTVEQLARVRHIEEDEIQSLVDGRRYLWRVRYGLHLLAERREDRLLFDFQREIAHRFGFRDSHRENLAVEQFMQKYFRTITHLERINERVLQAFEEDLLRDTEDVVETLDQWFEVRNGYLAAIHDDVFHQRPALLIEMFKTLAERPDIRGVRARTVRTIRHSLDLIDEDFRNDPDVQQAFMDILRSGGDVPGLLTRMHRYDILGRYLPVFGRIAGRMQYDLFHVYTVDQHTLSVLKRLREFMTDPDPDRYPLTSDLMWRISKPELLYLAGLFHDIAKGRGGDHSELGADDAEAFCEAHGLSKADTNLIVWLVRNHLLMSITAQKQDISDPEVVNRFARQVGNRGYLNYLYVLTIADISATSPKLWNNWKATLLLDLYRLTCAALRRGSENPARREEWIEDTQLEAVEWLTQRGIPAASVRKLWAPIPGEYFLRLSGDQVAWQTQLLAEHPDLPLVGIRQLSARGTTEVFVCAENRDGTFATLVTALSKLDLNIIDARVFNTEDSRILDTFQVLDRDGAPLSDFRRIQRLRELLVEDLSQTPLKPPRLEKALPRRLKHFVRKPRVSFSKRPDGRTEMEILASDRPGLLATVAGIFLKHAIRVHSARIATFGERVEDYFVLTDQQDRSLEKSVQKQLAEEIPAAIEKGLPEPVSQI